MRRKSQIAASGGSPFLLQHAVLSKHNVKSPAEEPRVPPRCCMWLKDECTEEIICGPEMQGGGFWKMLLEALGASECLSCGVIIS